MAERSSELEKRQTAESETPLIVSDAALAPTSGGAAVDTDDYSRNSAGDETLAVTTTGDATDVHTTEEPAQLKAQIEQTRSDMSETINAIQEKLSFSNIAEQVKDGVSEQISSAYESAKTSLFGATIGKAGGFMAKAKQSFDEFSEDYGPAISDAGTTVANLAKTNPVPLALIGLGIGLLIFTSGKKQKSASTYREIDGFDEDDLDYNYSNAVNSRQKSSLPSVSKTYGKVSDAAGQAASGIGSAASSAVSGVGSAANSAYSGVSSAAGAAYSGVSDAAGSAYEQVGNLGTQAKQAARWTGDNYSRQLEENPFAVGAVALAIGAAIGLALPSTALEGQYLGDARENLLQKAQDAAGGLIAKAQQAAGDVAKTVTEEVKAQTSKS